jgi:Holliday junction resolvasome RuvABC DNA-binding subunit
MIISIEGAVALRGERFIVVEAEGVGYRVFVSPETLRKIPEKSGKIKLWTHRA